MSNSTIAYSGDDFYSGHKHNDVFAACVLLATVTSSVSSLIVLLLLLQIYVVNKRANALYSNTFLSLLFYITIYQLVYDISFYYGVPPSKHLYRYLPNYPLPPFLSVQACWDLPVPKLVSSSLA